MRPTKSRIIGSMPRCRQFCPVEAEKEAVSLHGEEEAVVIALDMLEAMRLVDAEGMSQELAAQSMKVSTPTLCRILAQGRRLAAQAFSSGRPILFEGGNVMYGNKAHGHHGQGCGHGNPGRHGQAFPQGAECCGRKAGQGQGKCQSKGPGNGYGMGQGRRATGKCRRQADAAEEASPAVME